MCGTGSSTHGLAAEGRSRCVPDPVLKARENLDELVQLVSLTNLDTLKTRVDRQGATSVIEQHSSLQRC